MSQEPQAWQEFRRVLGEHGQGTLLDDPKVRGAVTAAWVQSVNVAVERVNEKWNMMYRDLKKESE